MPSPTRSYSELFKKGLEQTNNNESFFNFNNYNNLYQYGGQKDDRIDLFQITQYLMNTPVIMGIFTKISDIVDESEIKVLEVKKNGQLKETRPANEYRKLLLDTFNFRKDIQNFKIAAYGGGLGNALAYKIRNGKKIELKFDPFVVNGFHRVEVVTDQFSKNLEVLEYKILDQNQTIVYNFKPDQVYHYQFANLNGNPALGSNPLLHVAKYLRLMYVMMMSQDTIFSGGMQATKFFGVDIDAMLKLNASPDQINQATKKLAEDLRQANGIQNRNRAIILNNALKAYDVQMNNSELRTPELLPMLKEAAFNGYAVDPSILDISQSKYDNAEKAKDQLYQQIRPFIIDMQRYAEVWKLPQIDSSFDSSRFIVRFSRQFSDEEIRIKDAISKENQVYFQNLKTANEALGDINVKALPTPEKLKFFKENGITFETLGKETIDIAPSTDNQTADNFTQITTSESVKRQIDQDEIDEVYSKYHSLVNMSASELETWSENECSKNASLDRSPIARNLRLLRTPKSEWGQTEVTQANRTISFVSRMKGAEQGEATKTSDGKSCPSKRDISLKNWAYDPNKSQRSFYNLVKIKIDKSFQKVLHYEG